MQPWAFMRVPYMNPTILGVVGPGFLNQVPTLPIVSIVVPFLGYLLGSLIEKELNPKKGTTMETIGKP